MATRYGTSVDDNLLLIAPELGEEDSEEARAYERRLREAATLPVPTATATPPVSAMPLAPDLTMPMPQDPLALFQNMPRPAAAPTPVPAPAVPTMTPTPIVATTPGAIDRSSRDAFIRSMRPYAEAAAARTGIPADIMIAINLNEQGWQHAAPGNNYFGIKGSNPRTGKNTGPVATWEDYGKGRENIQDTFRSYDSPAESYEDFGNFLRDNSRYAKALQVLEQTGDGAAFLREVHKAGYATDPAWSDKVLRIANDVQRVGGQPTTLTEEMAAGQRAGLVPTPQTAPVPGFFEGLGTAAAGLASDAARGLAENLSGYTPVQDVAGSRIAAAKPLADFIGEQPLPGTFMLPKDKRPTVGSTLGNAISALGWYGENVNEPMTGAGRGLGLTPEGVTDFGRNAMLGGTSAGSMAAAALDMVNSPKAQEARRAIAEYIAQRNPQTPQEWVSALWQGAGHYERGRDEDFWGEKFLSEAVLDASNLLGIGLEAKAARAIAGQARKLGGGVRAGAERVGAVLTDAVDPATGRRYASRGSLDVSGAPDVPPTPDATLADAAPVGGAEPPPVTVKRTKMAVPWTAVDPTHTGGGAPEFTGTLVGDNWFVFRVGNMARQSPSDPPFGVLDIQNNRVEFGFQKASDAQAWAKEQAAMPASVPQRPRSIVDEVPLAQLWDGASDVDRSAFLDHFNLPGRGRTLRTLAWDALPGKTRAEIERGVNANPILSNTIAPRDQPATAGTPPAAPVNAASGTPQVPQVRRHATIAEALDAYKAHGDPDDELYLRWDDRDYSPGDTLPPSRVWDDNEATEDYLDGTSVIDPRTKDFSKSDLGGSYDGNLYLVRQGRYFSGMSPGYGDDPGEVILREPEVVRRLTPPRAPESVVPPVTPDVPPMTGVAGAGDAVDDAVPPVNGRDADFETRLREAAAVPEPGAEYGKLFREGLDRGYAPRELYRIADGEGAVPPGAGNAADEVLPPVDDGGGAGAVDDVVADSADAVPPPETLPPPEPPVEPPADKGIGGARDEGEGIQYGHAQTIAKNQGDEAVIAEIKADLDKMVYDKRRSTAELYERGKARADADPAGEYARLIKADQHFNEEDVATGMVLERKLLTEGKTDEALILVSNMAEAAMEGGRFVQAWTLWNRLTPEGMLLSVQRTFKKLAEKAKDKGASGINRFKENLEDVAENAVRLRAGKRLKEVKETVTKLSGDLAGVIEEGLSAATGKETGTSRKERSKFLKAITFFEDQGRAPGWFQPGTPEADALARMRRLAQATGWNLPPNLAAEWYDEIAAVQQLPKGERKEAMSVLIRDFEENYLGLLEERAAKYGETRGLMKRTDQTIFQLTNRGRLPIVPAPPRSPEALVLQEVRRIADRLGYRLPDGQADLLNDALDSLAQQIAMGSMDHTSTGTPAWLVEAKRIINEDIGQRILGPLREMDAQRALAEKNLTTVARVGNFLSDIGRKPGIPKPLQSEELAAVTQLKRDGDKIAYILSPERNQEIADQVDAISKMNPAEAVEESRQLIARFTTGDIAQEIKEGLEQFKAATLAKQASDALVQRVQKAVFRMTDRGRLPSQTGTPLSAEQRILNEVARLTDRLGFRLPDGQATLLNDALDRVDAIPASDPDRIAKANQIINEDIGQRVLGPLREMDATFTEADAKITKAGELVNFLADAGRNPRLPAPLRDDELAALAALKRDANKIGYVLSPERRTELAEWLDAIKGYSNGSQEQLDAVREYIARLTTGDIAQEIAEGLVQFKAAKKADREELFRQRGGFHSDEARKKWEEANLKYLIDEAERITQPRIRNEMKEAMAQARAAARTGAFDNMPPEFGELVRDRALALGAMPDTTPAEKAAKWQATQEFMQLMRMLMPPNKWQPLLDIFNGIGRIAKTMWDFSAGGIQGAFFMPSQPRAWVRAWKPALEAFMDADVAAQSNAMLRTRPGAARADAANLYLSDSTAGASLNAQEEQMWNNVSGGIRWKLPVIGGKEVKVAGRTATLPREVQIVGGGPATGPRRWISASSSGDAFTAFMNRFRADIFDKWADEAEALGIASESLLRDLAGVVNAGTGRGAHGWIDRYAGLASQMLYAPSYGISLLETPVQAGRAAISAVPGVRRVLGDNAYHPFVAAKVGKAWAAFLGLGMAQMLMGKMMGAKVEADPRSSNFGNIQDGPLRYNPFGQHGRLASVLVQLLPRMDMQVGPVAFGTGQTKSSTGNLSPTDRGGLLLNFGRNKLAPGPGALATLTIGEGRDPIGNNVFGPAAKDSLLGSVEELTGLPVRTALGKSGGAVNFAVSQFVPMGVDVFLRSSALYGMGGGALGTIPHALGKNISVYETEMDAKDRLAQQQYGVDYNAKAPDGNAVLDDMQKKAITDSEAVQEKREARADQPNYREAVASAARAGQSKLQKQMDSDTKLMLGDIDAKQWRREHHDINVGYAEVIENSRVKQLPPRDIDPANRAEVLAAQYYGIPMNIDPETKEEDFATFFMMRDGLMSLLSDEDRATLVQYLDNHDTLIEREYRRDMEKVRQYWDYGDGLERSPAIAPDVKARDAAKQEGNAVLEKFYTKRVNAATSKAKVDWRKTHPTSDKLLKKWGYTSVLATELGPGGGPGGSRR